MHIMRKEMATKRNTPNKGKQYLLPAPRQARSDRDSETREKNAMYNKLYMQRIGNSNNKSALHKSTRRTKPERKLPFDWQMQGESNEIGKDTRTAPHKSHKNGKCGRTKQKWKKKRQILQRVRNTYV